LTVPPAVTENDVIAYFPQSAKGESELLQSCFQDIPQGESALVEALLKPWPNNSLFYRFVSKLTGAPSEVAKHETSKSEVTPV